MQAGELLLVVVYRALEQAPLDVFPEFAPPIIEIQTKAPGLSSEQVESLVTIPLENVLAMPFEREYHRPRAGAAGHRWQPARA